MDSLVLDVRYAVRTLTKARGFTAVAVLTLALGIGANTIVFGIVNSVLLRPLAFDRPEQLVKIWGRMSKQGIPQNWISEPELWDMHDGLRSLASFAAYNAGTGANLTRGDSEPLRVTVSQASGELLPMLGVKPMLGRVFTSDEDSPGREHVVVLDYAFWKSQMAGDSGIVGRNIQLNGETSTVIGVLPQGFSFAGVTNMWVPLALDRAKPNNRGNHYLEVLARLNPGISLPQASADLEGVARKMAVEYTQFYPKDSGFAMYLRPLQTDLVGNARLGLMVVFAAVGFVLLIACINLANLLLARGSSRSRELAVRAALGAGRLRIARQLVTESVVIAIIGGGFGILLAAWATEALKNTAALALPHTRPIAIDAPVLFFAVGTSLITGLVFGLVPAMRTSNSRAYDAVKDAARGSSSAGGHQLRSGLVVAEIAMAVVLLVAAGLMVRSLLQLLEVNPGFRAEHLLTARISLPSSQYRDITAANAFFNSLEQRVQALPGVESAGMTTVLPMSGRNSSGSTFIEQTTTRGLTVGAPFQKPYIEADFRTITTAFFQSMQIPLLRGRMFTADDSADAARAIIVDEEFAKRIWPDRDPIGQRLAVNAIPNSNPLVLQWRAVVGVVGHVKNNALDQIGREQTYVPIKQTTFPIRSMYLAVRAAAEPKALAASIQRVVRGLDPSLPLYEMKTMSEWLDATVSPRRFNMMLLVAFGALALTLAAIGTYGVIAYSVSQRTQEIGIRMALGASQQDVLHMVVGGGLRLAVAGVLVGVGLALAAGRFMSTLLFGVDSTDPMTFSAVALVLLGTAALAAWVPARRATRVDPMVALRSE
jgi:putative ABC transport system permease protein